MQDGEQFAQENGMFYMETSAKTAENINELFYEIGMWLRCWMGLWSKNYMKIYEPDFNSVLLFDPRSYKLV